MYTYFWWWKSWASGEGKKGKWYPQWDTSVVATANENHNQPVATWDPMISGPITTGNILATRCSTGWA